MPLFLGQLVNNRYRIDALENQDQTGALYRAWDMNLNAPVAFLENLDSSPGSREQFGHEAELLTHLSHSNLPRILDHFTLSGQGQYLVMDQVEGDDLQTLLDNQGVLSQTDVIGWLAQVAEVLSYLRHLDDKSLLPDLEPADIVVRPNNRVTLLGFHLLKRHMPGKTVRTYERGIIPGFSAPELYGHNLPNERSDVYTLGATMYYLLTSQVPPESIQLATGSARLVEPGQLNPEVSPGVQQFVLKAMSPDATRRFQSLEEFQHQLQSLKFEPSALTEPVHEALAAPASTGGQSFAGWPIVLGGLGFLLGAIIVSVMYFAFMSGGTRAGASQPEAPRSATARPVVVAQTTAVPEQSTSTLIDFPTATPEPLAIEAAEDSPLGMAPSEIAANLPIDIINDPVTNAPMVLVPAGPFSMGGAAGGEDSLPKHQVSLTEFYVDQYEVTNAQYRACVDAGACQPPASVASYTREDYFTNPEFDDYPVVQISWDQAFTFCAWRDARLPTEAEWEKAARGSDGRTYPWGEGLDCSLANWATSSGTCVGDTAAVGSYPEGASPFGVMDLAGNVWEWVADWYAPDYYQDSPPENPHGPEEGELKVLRGGSWVSNELNLRAAFRNNLEPSSTSSNIGFRCAQNEP